MAEGMGSQHASRLVELVLESFGMPPDDLAGAVERTARAMGARDPVLLVIDLQQQSLGPLRPGGGDSLRRMPVDTTPAGEAFRRRRLVAVPAGAQQRWWLPVLDSADRVGVLGLSVDAGTDDTAFRALASLAGELLRSKEPYGDSVTLARRTRHTTVAAEMRWAMLPPLTFVGPDVVVSGILEPAYEIAGDTFDYAVNGSTAHLAILDAMGHGLEASRMANLAVSTYRHSRRTGRTLHQMSEDLDHIITDQFGPSKFVTGQLATLDLDYGVFRMLNLGHPLPLLLRGGRVVGELASTPALPAGLGSRPGELLEVQLEPGDHVLMHTDGITEARPLAGEEYGLERFIALVDRLLAAGEQPEELLRLAVNDVLAYQDQRARDDATLLIVGWRPEGS